MQPVFAHIIQRLHMGGIETLVVDLMKLERSRDVVLSLEASTDELIAKWPAMEPLRARIFGLEKKPGLDTGLPVRLARVLRKVSPAAVIAHHIGPLLYGAAGARLAGAQRFCHFEHDAWHYQNASHVRMLRWNERLFRPMHFASSTVVASKLREFLPDARVTVTVPGIDTERYTIADKAAARQALGLAAGGLLIGTVGRLEEVKGTRFLIEALAQLPGHVSLALIGGGSQREALETLAKTLNIASRVHFLGQRDRIEAILPAFDMFCLPSLNEGLPRAILEAQACGVPVVATDVGAVRSAVDRTSGGIVPPADPAALAQALARTLEHPSPSQAARAFVEANYTIESLRTLMTKTLLGETLVAATEGAPS